MHCCLDAVLFSINDALLYILFILNELYLFGVLSFKFFPP